MDPKNEARKALSELEQIEELSEQGLDGLEEAISGAYADTGASYTEVVPDFKKRRSLGQFQ